MTEYLVVLEVSQKQSYIFKTNRLIENIGASIIIRKVTEEIPKKHSDPENFVFEGGGKSVYAFDTEGSAKQFVSKVSREVLVEYPGVELFMAVHGYDIDSESVVDAINTLYGKLEKKKSARANSFRIYGLGITDLCVDTGLPAGDKEVKIGQKVSIKVSPEVACKIETGKKEQDRIFSELLPENKGYAFAKEFENLGGSRGNKNYISIIVIDGNKMGKKIERFREDFHEQNPRISTQSNALYKQKIRELSEEIDNGYKKAVRDMIQSLTDHLGRLHAKGIVEMRTGKNGEIFLPIRPLIMAGDDICFVTDARIGISATETVLRNIEKLTIQGLPMYACAGVAMVHASYPFFRAHALAEELCHNAKSILPSDDSKDASVIDFHMEQGEISGSLSTIRREQYHNATLTNKPFYLNASPENPEEKSMDYFRKRFALMNDKNMGRGFVKEYREVLYEGEDSAKQYLSDKRKEKAVGSSFKNGHCTDFDVIEMVDIYHELEVE